ncbi:MAG: hypothetical protein ACYC6N_24070 [Pirellulaceae bacterium]
MRVQSCLLCLFVSVCGCARDYARQYGYTEPQVPDDIPHYINADPKVRGIDQPDTDDNRIDLHRRYLVAHRAGFCEAAQQWEESGRFTYSSFADINEFDASTDAKRGYWDGYCVFKQKVLPHQDAQKDHGVQSRAQVGTKSLAAELEDAYDTASAEKLGAFFQRWHDSVGPKAIGEVKDPVEKELYALFHDWYNPFALNTIAGGEGYAEVGEAYARAKYILVQESVRVKIGESPERTITDFRPDITFDHVAVLHLTPAYRAALVAFLEADDTAGRVDVERSILRVQFLRQYVRLRPGHWSGWDLETPPTVNLVTWEHANTTAIVSFSILSDHGVASLERGTDGWHVTEAGIVAVE